MEKDELLAHFCENYVDSKSEEKIVELENYYLKNQEQLALGILEAFQKICLKAKTMQAAGAKEKIAYISFSLRRINILNHRYFYVVEAFDEYWFDDPARCAIDYDVSWAFKFLDEFEADLAASSKIYLNKITVFDLERFKLQELPKYHEVLTQLAKYSFKDLGKLPEFQELEKELVIEVRVDEYQEFSEVVYKEDHRIKDSREIKRWLELKEESYRYEILKNLDLSEGDYAALKLNYGDLSGSNLTKSDLSEGMFVGTKFQGCEADEADFHGADLREADFRNASLIRANFVGANLCDACFDGANLFEADLREARLGGVTFEGVALDQIITRNDQIESGADEDELDDGDDKA